MRAVLDSNIFIFALREEKEECAIILKLVGLKFTYVIPQLVINEVFERLKGLEGKDFAAFALHTTKSLKLQIIPDELIPKALIKKHADKGAKEGDAVIAAFVEWIKADCLVTENRDFLSELKLDFKIHSAKEFIKIITHT